MSLIEVDTSKCQRDRICAQECPGKLIIFPQKDSYPTTIEQAGEFCIDCGHCIAVCPHGALKLKGLGPEKLEAVNHQLLPSPSQVRHFLTSRRSTRTFKKKVVSRQQIEELIDIARYAPSGSNKQQVHWLVIEGQDKVQHLAGMVADWMCMMLQHSQDEAMNRRYARVVEAWDQGVDRILRRAPSVIIAHAPADVFGVATDCVISLTYLELAAYSQGLGTCWAGFLTTAATYYPPLQEALELPAGHLPYGALMLGYPVYQYQRIPQRQPARVIWS
ncbi:MAG TPA: nitroreductase family protein [Syntrophomonadaceae bacterium]|mgnify:CR=1 FL=1|nr:nitroreductase family protein [Syntrophomonadaceae bacterium]HQA06950.1 nitroreductase family protein [Syntrophomonadaceae bacterium]HQE23156.1 nitroreductase family protein [Syntrophomonadaceae bacterium]